MKPMGKKMFKNKGIPQENEFGSQLKSFMGSVSLAGVQWIIDCRHWAARQVWVLVVLAALTLTGLRMKPGLCFFLIHIILNQVFLLN
jgi:hypothetical protein